MTQIMNSYAFIHERLSHEKLSPTSSLGDRIRILPRSDRPSLFSLLRKEYTSCSDSQVAIAKTHYIKNLALF